MTTTRGKGAERDIGLDAAHAASRLQRGSSTLLRGVIGAAVGAAIVLLLGGMYFATNAGTDYPEASPIAIGD